MLEIIKEIVSQKQLTNIEVSETLSLDDKQKIDECHD